MTGLQAFVSGELVLFFVIGLLGGAHCIGMCGPLVTIYSKQMARDDERRGHLSVYEVRQHGLFNLGRTASYALLGGLFGVLGTLVYVTADSLTAVSDLLRGSLGTIVGLFVIAMGVYYLFGRVGGGGIPSLGIGAGGLFGALSARLHRLASGPGIVGLGALHGLLPCPILYPAFLYAFAVGSPTAGFLALAALGLGTIPAVFLYGTVIESVDAVHRRRVHRLLGVAFVALGYVLFAHGLMAFGVHLPHPELPHYQPLDGPGHAGH